MKPEYNPFDLSTPKIPGQEITSASTMNLYPKKKFTPEELEELMGLVEQNKLYEQAKTDPIAALLVHWKEFMKEWVPNNMVKDRLQQEGVESREEDVDKYFKPHLQDFMNYLLEHYQIEI